MNMQARQSRRRERRVVRAGPLGLRGVACGPRRWLKSGSVIAASVLHGTLNASAGIALLFARGRSDLVVGVTGAAGLIAVLLPNAAILLFDRRPGPAPSSSWPEERSGAKAFALGA